MLKGCYIYFRMPNQRAKGQKLLPVMASEEFIQALDANLSRAGLLEPLAVCPGCHSRKIDACPHSHTRRFVTVAFADKSGSYAPNDSRLAVCAERPPSSKPASKLALAVEEAVGYAKTRPASASPVLISRPAFPILQPSPVFRASSIGNYPPQRFLAT